MEEYWDEHDDFPGYEISDQGRVRNSKTGRILKISDNGSNSMIVNLQRYGRAHVQQVRWLVAQIFLGTPDNLDSIPQHKNGDYTDCRAENLEWMSRSDVHWRLYQKSQGMDPDNRPIEILNTGQIFPNIFECARAINGYAKEIHRTMYNHGYSYKGLQFAYSDGGDEFYV